MSRSLGFGFLEKEQNAFKTRFRSGFPIILWLTPSKPNGPSLWPSSEKSRRLLLPQARWLDPNNY